MNCTEEGQTTTTVQAGIKEVTASTRSAETPRCSVYGRAKTGGHIVYMQTSGSLNEHLHIIAVLCDGPVSSVDEIYLGDEKITLAGNLGVGKWANVYCAVHLGDAEQAADDDLIAASGGKWTLAHRLQGICYLYLKISQWDPLSRSPSPAVFDRVPSISAVVMGSVRNAAAAFAVFRESRNLPPINPASLAAAIAYCDETIGGLPRYTVGGVVESSASTEDVVRQFLTAMQVTLSHQSGMYFINLGALANSKAPALTWDHVLDESVVLVRTAGEKESVQATYQGEETNWAKTDSVGSGATNRSLKLNLVDNEAQAQRVAESVNRKIGPQEKLELTVTTHFADVSAGDAIMLNLPSVAFGNFNVTGTEFILNDLTPRIRLSLERPTQTESSAATARTDAELTLILEPRILAAPVVTILGAAYPYEIQATGQGLRWKYDAPLTGPEDGTSYGGPIPYPAARLLHISSYRLGWQPSTSIVQLT